jgi:hypothetical protein
VLSPYLRDGARVVGLEPSCTAVFRNDGIELLPDNDDVARLQDATVTLAELLDEHTEGWVAPQWDIGARRDTEPGFLDASDRHDGAAQVHCHQHAVLGWEADARVLAAMGLDVPAMESGCCGLAGNFGFERGHFATSRRVAENGLLPALGGLPEDALVLADGFSCRTQIGELGGRRAHHLAEVLAEALRRQRTHARNTTTEEGRHMPGPHEAVLALVTEQHQKVKALIAEVERGSGDERASAYRAFQDFLAAHEAVEELVLHPPLMHVAEGNSVAQDRVDEEHQATSLVEQLEQFDVDDPRFATTFGELAGAVTQHAEAEEHQELTMLLPRLDEEVAGRVVTALQAVGPVADALGYDGPLGKRGFSATLDAAKAEVVRRGLTEPAGG